MTEKQYTKKVLNHLKRNLGDRNFGILIVCVADACDYTMGEKGLKEIRQIEIKFNNLHTTKIDLSNKMKETH